MKPRRKIHERQTMPHSTMIFAMAGAIGLGLGAVLMDASSFGGGETFAFDFCCFCRASSK
jgi:hypothetical protein